ncbi:MAG: iron ABC transporter permease [Bacteroidaceae bacterium]|nr:iron ABC transporter permease [Bacteroidaceae bacterium]
MALQKTQKKKREHRGLLCALCFLCALCSLFILNLFVGTVSIPAEEVFRALTGGEVTKASWKYIVLESRLPSAVTALLCGASLAASGLMLQTAFRNPLAGPSILGITNGASLGVALVMLWTSGVVSTSLLGTDIQLVGILAVIIAALIGSAVVMAVLLLMSSLVHSNTMLLIVGIMFGYLTGSIISLLNVFASSDHIFAYVVWGLGSFSSVTLQQLPWFSAFSLIGLALSVLLIKPLNALLLGDQYAQNLGFNIRRIRSLLLLSTGLLTAVATAFCGPVAFLGLATPHIARMMTGTENHKHLLPTTILTGSAIALLCNLLCILPPNTILPLNAVTPMIGAPVILYVILCRRQP